MFDLPTGSKAERKSYADFRKFLVKDGFAMEQFSVYSRLVFTLESSRVHVERIRGNLPKAGVVTVFELTEKQYEDRLTLLDTSARPAPREEGAQLTIAF